MRIVLDTNVLVSAFLSAGGAPAHVVELVLAGELKLLFDERILSEYREVLGRPRFELEPEEVAEVLARLEADGERVTAAAVDAPLPDAGDRAFVEVALSGQADAVVTGNARHFPSSLGLLVLSPRELLERLESE